MKMATTSTHVSQRVKPNILWQTYFLILNEILEKTDLDLNWCGMSSLLVLVSPCFRENVVVTCKIGSFLCSLDNLFRKNVIVFFFFFFGNQISKWRSYEKELFLTYFSHFLVTREKLQKFLQHISHSHTCILLTLLTFFEKKNTNLSGMVYLRGDSWCWFLFAPFWNNQ